MNKFNLSALSLTFIKIVITKIDNFGPNTIKTKARLSKFPKTRSKISNLLTTELFYSHILNMNRGSLHTSSFRRILLSAFNYRLTKNGFAGPKSFRAFRETGPFFSNQKLTLRDNKQLLDEVGHDIMNYQNRGLCYLPQPSASADNTDTRFW